MMLIRALLLALLLTSPALAQDQPDPALLARLVGALQQQRNAAQDQHALAESRLQIVSDDLAKASARVAELEKQIKPKE